MAGKTDYKNQWQKDNCERISLVVKKGRKAVIQAHAEAHSESISGFINRAITETMERDNGAPGAVSKTEDVRTLCRSHYQRLQAAIKAVGPLDTEAKRELVHILAEEETAGTTIITKALDI